MRPMAFEIPLAKEMDDRVNPGGRDIRIALVVEWRGKEWVRIVPLSPTDLDEMDQRVDARLDELRRLASIIVRIE